MQPGYIIKQHTQCQYFRQDIHIGPKKLDIKYNFSYV